MHHFTRNDGQRVTSITFLCENASDDVTLSSEHTQFEWCNLKTALTKVHPAFREEIVLYQKFFQGL